MNEVATFDERLARIDTRLVTVPAGDKEAERLRAERARIERLINWARGHACECK